MVAGSSKRSRTLQEQVESPIAELGSTSNICGMQSCDANALSWSNSPSLFSVASGTSVYTSAETPPIAYSYERARDHHILAALQDYFRRMKHPQTQQKHNHDAWIYS